MGSGFSKPGEDSCRWAVGMLLYFLLCYQDALLLLPSHLWKEGRFGCRWPNVKIPQGSVDRGWGEWKIGGWGRIWNPAVEASLRWRLAGMQPRGPSGGWRALPRTELPEEQAWGCSPVSSPGPGSESGRDVKAFKNPPLACNLTLEAPLGVV